MPERGADKPFSEVKPDPSYIGGVAQVPFARLPDPATVFAARAARLRQVADGHVLADYLRFAADVVSAQDGAVRALPPPAPAAPEQVALAAEHGMPPLAAASLRGNADFAATTRWLMQHVNLDHAPAAAQEAAEEVRRMSDADVEALAVDLMQGAYPADRLAAALFVAAALQVHLARLASALPADALGRQEEGVCPSCGGVPVSSLVVGWTQASKARYCACSLCGTQWNHVRIRCTACGSTEAMAYYTIEDGPQTIGVETCGKCRSYIKHMQQHEDTALEPLADDIASYALDLLAQELDFRRSTINPLFVTG